MELLEIVLDGSMCIVCSGEILIFFTFESVGFLHTY